MFASRLVLMGVVLLALSAIALGAARSSSGAAPETRYVVQPGDTLWMLATTRYEGDPREALWRIQERNGLTSPMLRPGEVIVLP